jgi:hypothetical protein
MSYQWNPTADSIERVNVTRVARAHGVAGIEELPTRSAVTDLGLFRGTLPLRLMETN